MGLFDTLKKAIKKTSDLLNTDIRDLFKRHGQLVNDEFLEELRALLLRTDMGVKSSRAITGDIGNRFRGRRVEMEEVLAAVKENVQALLAQPLEPIQFAEGPPTVIMVCGVNGSGKTTSIAKLAYLFRSQDKSVVLGAGDTFRAAAVEQLTIWAQRLECEIVTGKPGADPASVAHQAVQKAVQIGADVCIVDTAGRLQTQTNLMNELAKIRRVIGKALPDAPHEVLLVLDATTGQNGLSQALKFSESVACSGIVLAKLDGTAKGGVVVAIRQQFELPVKFVGTGEKAEDLEVFDSQRFADALFAES